MERFSFTPTESTVGMIQQLAEYVNAYGANNDGEIIWSNPDFSETFPSTDINITLSNYRYIMIKFGYSVSGSVVTTNNVIVTSKDEKVCVDSMDSSTNYFMSCNRYVTVKPTKITISTCKKIYLNAEASNSAVTTDNARLKPISITAYK